jgi:hypothetical protein
MLNKGMHDIASVLLLVLEDERLTYFVLERLVSFIALTVITQTMAVFVSYSRCMRRRLE